MALTHSCRLKIHVEWLYLYMMYYTENGFGYSLLQWRFFCNIFLLFCIIIDDNYIFGKPKPKSSGKELFIKPLIKLKSRSYSQMSVCLKRQTTK